MTRLRNLALTLAKLIAVAAVVFGGIAVSSAQTWAAIPDQPPRPIIGTQIVPIYPSISRRRGEQGTSGLQLSISADGHITDCQIIKSSGAERLDNAACEYVKGHWRYQPATHNGIPVASSDRTSIVWDLHGVSVTRP